LLFTGSLLNRDRLADLIATPRLPPVMLIHGAEDEVIPLDKVMRNAATLEQFGLSVHQHICPGLGHSLNEEGAMAGALFALEQLARS
ncbi:MAG: prolyl oligopeptidase family serine peptidase, partial [Pseudomonadales bacterium]|nr:prolyl oligopeptidase family serine peptidase [Pseudomonadales bacterium]